MAFKLQPLQNNVVIKPGAREEVSRGGVIIPDAAQEKSQEGEVVAVGPGRISKDGNRETIDVKVGDIVLYPKFSGAEYKIEGETFIILPENTIISRVV
jgi:chaperonin GroES